jgi:hypothetical protein
VTLISIMPMIRALERIADIEIENILPQRLKQFKR